MTTWQLPRHRLRRPQGRPGRECGRWGGAAWLSMPPGSVKTAEGGVAPAARSLDAPGSRGGGAPQIRARLNCPVLPSRVPWVMPRSCDGSGQARREAALVWGGSAPPGNAAVKGKGATCVAPACGALDSRGGHVAHALHPPHRPHSRPGRPSGRRRLIDWSHPSRPSPVDGRRSAIGDCRAERPRFDWGAAPPRRTPIVKTSRRSRDAAFGGLDIGGRRGIHASFPPRRRHSPASRPCGRRRF